MENRERGGGGNSLQMIQKVLGEIHYFYLPFQPIFYHSFFFKNIVYTNIQAQNHPIFKNVMRILLSLSSHIRVAFFNSFLLWDVYKKGIAELIYIVFPKAWFLFKSRRCFPETISNFNKMIILKESTWAQQEQFLKNIEA